MTEAATKINEQEKAGADNLCAAQEAREAAPDTMEFNAFSALPEMSEFEEQAEKLRRFRETAEKKIDDIDKEFRHLRSAVVSYKEDVYKALYEPFLTKLAELMQDMEQCKDSFALRLEYIIKSMGMQPISPEPGDAFSYDMHKRERCDSTGMTVRKCIVRGWKLGNRLLAGAVVTTD